MDVCDDQQGCQEERVWTVTLPKTKTEPLESILHLGNVWAPPPCLTTGTVVTIIKA